MTAFGNLLSLVLGDQTVSLGSGYYDAPISSRARAQSLSLWLPMRGRSALNFDITATVLDGQSLGPQGPAYSTPATLNPTDNDAFDFSITGDLTPLVTGNEYHYERAPGTNTALPSSWFGNIVPQGSLRPAARIGSWARTFATLCWSRRQRCSRERRRRRLSRRWRWCDVISAGTGHDTILGGGAGDDLIFGGGSVLPLVPQFNDTPTSFRQAACRSSARVGTGRWFG